MGTNRHLDDGRRDPARAVHRDRWSSHAVGSRAGCHRVRWILLVWAGVHYEALHGPLRDGDPIVHPTAARTVGIVTVLVSGASFVFGVMFAF